MSKQLYKLWFINTREQDDSVIKKEQTAIRNNLEDQES